MCNSCDIRVNTAVSVVCCWIVRVMGVYMGDGCRKYNNVYNERGVQS